MPSLIGQRFAVREKILWYLPLTVNLFIGLILLSVSLVIVLSLIPLYLPTRTINHQTKQSKGLCKPNVDQNQVEILKPNRYDKNSVSQKIRMICPIVILGGGVAGSHSAYRLGSTHQNQICVFDRNNYVGGRVYDLDSNGNIPPAYDKSRINPHSSVRFYAGQAVTKELADELNISYTKYDYKTLLINTRGQFYKSLNEMCLNSYINLTCTNDSNGLDPADQLWKRLLDQYHQKPLDLYRFGDFPSYCRYVLGDEATQFLRDTNRHRSYFESINAYSFLEHYDQEFKLKGTIYYPNEGMSQFPKRMMYNAMKFNDVKLYLNEEIIRIDDNTEENCYPFLIETTHYIIFSKQLILGLDPIGWQNITGSIANDIKSNEHFQSILPIKTVTIQTYWSSRWWEQSQRFGSNIDRVWARQNCIVAMEIYSQRPEERDQNLTRTVYDDGQCTELWSALIQRSSQQDLIDELLRGLRSIYTDVQIDPPTKIFTHIWPGAWHYQKPNSIINNQQIIQWALNPLTRFNKNQLSLVGEAFFLDRAQWIEAAIKSSLISLTSQFNFNFSCYQNDAPSGGNFCPYSFV